MIRSARSRGGAVCAALLSAAILSTAAVAQLASLERYEQAERLALAEADFPAAMHILASLIEEPGQTPEVLVKAHLLKGAIRYLGRDEEAARLSFQAALALDSAAAMPEKPYNREIRAFFQGVKRSVPPPTSVPEIKPLPAWASPESGGAPPDTTEEDRLSAGVAAMKRRGDWFAAGGAGRRFRIGQVPARSSKFEMRFESAWQTQLFLWVDDALRGCVSEGWPLILAPPLRWESRSMEPGAVTVPTVDEFYSRYEARYSDFLKEFSAHQRLDLLLYWDRVDIDACEGGDATIEYMVYDAANNAMYPSSIRVDCRMLVKEYPPARFPNGLNEGIRAAVWEVVEPALRPPWP